MNSFPHFPPNATCPVCGTNSDSACVLIPIDGTANDGVCEASPVHLSCLSADAMRYSKSVGVIYLKTKGA
jgi:hypothetical protein